MYSPQQASISFLDHNLGRVLASLDAHGLSATTAVIFHSDHGWSLGEDGQWEKFSNREEALRVPLIVAAPWLHGAQQQQQQKTQQQQQHQKTQQQQQQQKQQQQQQQQQQKTQQQQQQKPHLFAPPPHTPQLGSHDQIHAWVGDRALAGSSSSSLYTTTASTAAGSSGLARSDTLVELVDVFPTLLSLAGVPMPPDGGRGSPFPLTGRDLAPLVASAYATKEVRTTKEARAQDAAVAMNATVGRAGPTDDNDDDSEVGAGAVFSQFPRCPRAGQPAWQANNCDSLERHEFPIMGYSVRDAMWRLTLWQDWDGEQLGAKWGTTARKKKKITKARERGYSP